MTLYDYCIENNYTELLDQWDSEKNGGLTPKDVLHGSHMKAWWRCEKGHEWEAAVFSRGKNGGCPYCAGQKVLMGFNDLKTVEPELAAQWHPTLNGELTPEMVTGGSKQKVWWRCDDGHEWEATVSSRNRSKRNGCPVCSNRLIISGVNDLATVSPELAAQWHPILNGELSPDKVASGSNSKAWWICDKGHEYYSPISHRVKRNTGCPYCAGKKVLVGFNDLATVQPKIASQWHPNLNGELTSEIVSWGSNKKAWWQCSEGHAWQAKIVSRTGTKKCGCPVCAGNISKKRLAKYAAILKEAEKK